ncbi:MAG: hypothetical protein HY644_08895 [Acidobacteria bacterium]|nr:hypothetical protein [Acidobacteriota bacterium]
MIYFYVAAISLVLVFHVFYQHVASLRCDEREVRHLEKVELHLAHILRLLDAPDVRLLMEIPQSRHSLFLEFSDSLKKDVLELVRLRALGIKSLVYAGIFFVCYYLIRFKARLLCSRQDLRFLSGLELAFFRTLQEAR